MNKRHFNLAVQSDFRVDRETGTLRNLSLMVADREAKGHGFHIDGRTLETALAAVAEKGGLLKAYYTHDHSGPAGWGADESEMKIPGYFSGIKIHKGQLVAEKFEFYETFRTHYPAETEQILEMAEKTPSLFGLSVEIWGYLVFVAPDSTEYSERPEGADLLHDGRPVLRITDLFAAAFVSDGAATDGLFATLSRKLLGKTTRENPEQLFRAFCSWLDSDAGQATSVNSAPISRDTNKPEDSDMKKLIEALKQKFGSDKARFAAAMATLGEHPDLTTVEEVEARLATAPVPPSETGIVAELKKRFGEDKTRFAAAMTIFGEDPTLSVQQIEANLAAQETADLRARLSASQTECEQLRTEKKNLATERDDLKQRIEKLRNSGHMNAAGAQLLGVNLGTPGHAHAPETPNPYHPATRNLTAQHFLEKNDPEKAKALKAAAGVA